jgi:outer membrane protein OmpA-like peptidoglycan-associated protein
VLVIAAPLGLAYAAGTGGVPPNPPSEPSAKDFWIYFDSSRFDIRPDGTDTLDGVVRAIKQLGRPKVILTGHADTAGSRGDDMMLTRRRAEQAKAYLVKQGVPAEDITTVAKGKTDLRVATPRNSPSQENRNVHIELE